VNGAAAARTAAARAIVTAGKRGPPQRYAALRVVSH
jgi:hypothetical protein